MVKNRIKKKNFSAGLHKIMLIAGMLFIACGAACAQESYRPGLFFREDWKEIPAEIPLSQKHMSNPELTVQLYGTGRDSLKKSNHEQPVDDPYYVWSGLCLSNWLVSLKHKQYNADLTVFSKIRWRTKQAGLRQLRIALKLADSTWLISDLSDGPSKDWRITEFNLQDVKWYRLDIGRIVEIGPVANPDLSNVEEIGFTDLMPGGLSASCSRLDWIEVDGNPVKR
jgi:hypothetical protein